MSYAQRGKFALAWAAKHLAASLFVAGAAAALVFILWYPHPTSQMLGVARIYGLMLAVDVVCGPLLTLVMASPKKSRRELVLDLGVVAAIQLAALGYGLHALYMARPVAFVFEEDRVVVVTRNELVTGENDLTKIPALPLFGLDWHKANLRVQGDGKLESLDLSLQGVSPAMRTETWTAWSWDDTKLQSRLRSLAKLGSKQQVQVRELRGADFLQNTELVYLPLVSSKNLDWIIIFDKKGQWVDSLPVDGFAHS
nr:hypothetical protein [Comamonas koreensis]